MITKIKTNKVAVLSIAAIVVVAILLALPSQFAHIAFTGNGYSYRLGGYQAIFNTAYKFPVESKIHIGNSVIGAGIAALVMMFVAIVAFIFHKKSSSLVLLGGLLNFVSSILFLSMEASIKKAYSSFVISTDYFCSWVTYVAGALLLIVGIYAIYKAIMLMKDEIKHPKPVGPSYNYLKK